MGGNDIQPGQADDKRFCQYCGKMQEARLIQVRDRRNILVTVRMCKVCQYVIENKN